MIRDKKTFARLEGNCNDARSTDIYFGNDISEVTATVFRSIDMHIGQAAYVVLISSILRSRTSEHLLYGGHSLRNVNPTSTTSG